MAELRWFMNDPKQFLLFCEVLGSARSDSVFGTEFVKTVLDEFWDDCYKKLLYACFLPYCLGLISYLILVHKVFAKQEFDPDAEQPSVLFVQFSAMIFVFYQICLEIIAYSGS